MKKTLLIFLMLFALIFSSACVDMVDNGKLKVCVSIYPVYDFTKKIAGDKINIINLSPTGDTHHFELSPYDRTQIAKSDLLLYNGAGMENWIDDLFGSMQGEKVSIQSVSKGIELISGEHESEHNFDPHIWLNPLNAKKQMENIKNILIEKDSLNADFYKANYEHYAAAFDELDQEYKTQLQSLITENNDTIVVIHQAFGYLCQSYGINQIALTDENDSKEPSIEKKIEVINLINVKNIKAVFYDELENIEMAQSLCEDVDVECVPMVLYPIGSISESQKTANEDYFSLMRKNLQALISALS